MNDAVDVDTIVAGIILCGGKSTRMGGPKESLPLGGGVTMLGRVVEVVSAVVSPVVVVAAVGQKLPALPEHIRVVRDDMPDVGPLQGLATGLRSLQGQAAAAYVSSCDVPLLRPEFIVRLAERLEGADIAVPFVNEKPHPLAGIYRLRVLEEAEKLLAAGERRVTALLEKAPTRLVKAEELDETDSLHNVNTPDDYRMACMMLWTSGS